MTDIELEDLSFEEHCEYLALTNLGLFWKFQVIPTFIVPYLVERKLVRLYELEEGPFKAITPYIKLSMRGRKLGPISYKCLEPGARETGTPIQDPYSNGDHIPGIKYLMHHERFEREYNSGDSKILLDLYALCFEY